MKPAFCGVLCSSLLGATACCPCRMSWVTLNAALPQTRIFINGSRISGRRTRSAARARRSDWRWMNCKNCWKMHECSFLKESLCMRQCVCVRLQIDGNYKMRLARRYWNGVWWSGLSMQDTCMEISEAMLRRSGEQAVLYPPPFYIWPYSSIAGTSG